MDKIDEIAALLSEAAETHSQVYRLTDGEDADWASWYAKWLIELSELPDVLGEEPVPSHLIYELVRLEREYAEVQPEEPWELYYAAQLLEEFGAEDSEDDDSEDEGEESDEEFEGEEAIDEYDESGEVPFAYDPEVERV